MQLVGCLDSPFVRRIAVTLHHYGLAFDRKRLLTFGHFDQVLKIHPLGKIPALVLDDGEVLIDSSCILDHFDWLIGEERSLTPLSGSARTRVQQVVAVALGLAEKSVEYRTETVRRPAEKFHAEAIARVSRQIELALTWLQSRLPGMPTHWLLLDRMTQADVTAAIAVTNLTNKNPELVPAARFGALLRWVEGCEALPPFRAAPYMLE